jgi:hypothetical protein
MADRLLVLHSCRTQLSSANTYHQSTYPSVSLIWNPIGGLDLGAEFLYGRVEEKCL